MSNHKIPIAIVGIGCRFPGGASSPAAFWELLCDGIDAITELPADRFDLDGVYDPDPTAGSRIYTKWGGFVEGVDGFDAGFFGLSPREAVHIDPQHRMLLEVTYEAFEDAGIPIDRHAGSATGVFVGISTHDYGDVHVYPGNRALIDAHSNTGNATSLAANRISYLYDFRGPSLIVDTACSSSLTAAHFACRSLWSGECDTAVLAGVQFLMNTELTIGFCKATMLSPTGRCHAFSSAADGYVRAEGSAAVVLKRLDDAERDGDRVYAVIRGTAVNQDGHTQGMTMPSGSAQAAMIRAALSDAGVEPADVQYVEAHGTGTPVGDPIEAGAIGAVFGPGREADAPLLVGSVKTNVGHLEAASGMAGLVKAALAVHHRQLAPSLHFDEPNPAIDFDGLGLRVVTELEPWPGTATPTASVNSFGFGGSNANVVLQAAPERTADPEDDAISQGPGGAELLILSARTSEGLDALAREYLDVLGRADAPPWRELCRATAYRRAHQDHRLAVVAAEALDGADALDGFVAGERRAAVAAGRRRAAGAGPLAFVFSGMGPQWWGMGRQLMASEPTFREVIERCDKVLAPLASWSLIEELGRDEATSRVSEADLAQVTNFAIQVALTALWGQWGITPDAVMGHSAGEMAAAYVAGAIDLDDAVLLAYHRSRLQARASGTGNMLAVGLGVYEAEELVASVDGRVSLAAVNAPTSITLSGDADALESIAERLQARQVFARMLPVVVPYHSALMDGIERELIESLQPMRLNDTTIPMVSVVTGTWVDGRDLGPDYWWRNIRQPVQFADGIACLSAEGTTTFLEIAPHPVLSASIRECLASAGRPVQVVGSLRRMEDEREAMLRALGALYTGGRMPDWDGLYGGRGHFLELPGYPWQRERHWFEPAAGSTAAGGGLAAATASDPMLGGRARSATPLWQSGLGGDNFAWLDDHIVGGSIIYPGAAYVDAALAAAAEVFDTETPAVRDVEFQRALFLNDRSQTLLQLSGPAASVAIHASVDGGTTWNRHAVATLGAGGEAIGAVDLTAARARCPEAVDRAELFERFARRGLQYGPAFMGITEVARGVDEVVMRVETQAGVTDIGGYRVHPALLDAALQGLVVAIETAGNEEEHRVLAQAAFLPTRVARVAVHGPTPAAFWVSARLVSYDERSVTGHVDIVDDNGRVLVEVRGLEGRFLDRGAASEESLADSLYELRWEDAPATGQSAPVRVLGTVEDTAAAFAELTADVAHVASDVGWDEYYARAEPQLESAAGAFAIAALAAIGWSAPAAGSDGNLDAIADSLGVPVEQRQLLAACISAAAAAPVDGDAAQRAESILDDLIRTSPAFTTDATLLRLAGRRLANVVTGRISGVEVLFDAEAAPVVAAFYRDAPVSRFGNTVAARTMAAIAASRRPDAGDRPLRILEVGGGTGGTTVYALDALAGRPVDYTFTDVSPLFVSQAGSQIAASAPPSTALTTGVFDIERDPRSQGLDEASFDIVLGANVVHTTADVAAALTNLHRLLVPGGALILIEVTRRPHWPNLIFGLTDGWWRFTDDDLRPDHAIMTPAQWRAALDTTGFEGIETIADTPSDGEAGQTVLVARSCEDTLDTPHVADSDRPAWLVLTDGDGARLADALGARLAVADVPAIVVAATDIAGAVTALAGTAGVVYITGSDQSDDDLDADEIVARGARSCAAVAEWVRATAALPPPPAGLWLVTSGGSAVVDTEVVRPSQGLLWGLGRVIVEEQPTARCRLVDLPAEPTDADLDVLAAELDAAAKAPARAEVEGEIAIRDGVRSVHRLRRLAIAGLTPAVEPQPLGPDDAFTVEVATPGALDTVELRRTARRAPGPGEVEIRIGAAGINFRDVMLAMGMIPSLASDGTFGGQRLGIDLAGTVIGHGPDVTNVAVGDRVIAIARSTFGRYSTTRAELVVPCPATLTMTEASAVACAFVTAHYALVEQARLRSGERVLIHAGTGGVGLAAIQIARAVGAHVLATAGSPEKRQYLRDLGVAHVFDSRTLAFADDVMACTDGAGVDVVLNSLAGEAIAKGISTLAPYGRFVEIGKRDIYDNTHIGLLAFRQNLSFFAVDLDRLCLERPVEVGRMMQEIVDRLASGDYQALPEQVFPVGQAEHALRFMAQARHIGKVVLDIDDPAAMVIGTPDVGPLFRTDGTYLVTGGLGGFGLEVAEWMASQGAGHLVLMGRSGADTIAAGRVDDLRATGVEVVIVQGDVAIEADVQRVLSSITDAPLRGVIHAAMVLDDAPLEEMDEGRFRRALAAKVGGAWNLHRQTRDADLDCFVLFSSIAGLLGNSMQANYAAANTYLDALAHHRKALGLPALAVDWGVLSGVGYVARHAEIGAYLERQGYLTFSPERALDALAVVLRGDRPQVMTARIDWKRWATSSPRSASAPRLAHLVLAAGGDGPAGGRGQAAGATALLAMAPEERPAAVTEVLRAIVGRVLGLNAAKVDCEQPLSDLGFDSLIAVELMTALEVELGVDLPVVKLLQDVSVADIALQVLAQLESGAFVIPAPTEASDERSADPSPPPPPTGDSAVIASPVATTADALYASLDYGRWSRGQRAVKRAFRVGIGAGAHIEMDGAERLPADGAFILALNHLAFVDTPLVLTVMPRPTIIFAAGELEKYPWMQWFLGDMGHAIWVQRGSGDSESVAKGLTVLRNGGVLGLSPEGRRSATGALERAQTGVAYLAAGSGAPVIPMAVWGQEHMRASWRRLRRAQVHIKVGEPLRFTPPLPEGATPKGADLLAFTTRVMSALSAMLPPEYRGVYADEDDGATREVVS